MLNTAIKYHSYFVHVHYNIVTLLVVSVVVRQDDINRITVFEDHIYWTLLRDWWSRSIYRANKTHGTNITLIINLYYPYDIHMYHPSRQPEGLYNLLYTTLSLLLLILFYYFYVLCISAVLFFSRPGPQLLKTIRSTSSQRDASRRVVSL